jgi:hypothetical protein
MKPIVTVGFILAALLPATSGSAHELEYLGRPVRNIPVSSAVQSRKNGLCVRLTGVQGRQVGDW